MIHLALVIIAVCVVLWAGMAALHFVASAFDDNAGCGCLALVVVLILGIVVLALAF